MNSANVSPKLPDQDAARGVRVDEPAELLDGTSETGWGSDILAETLRALDVPFVALNPGASYRGLHDSVVNYLGNRSPSILLCLHEEHAVSIAHAYAKVTERPMAVVLHSNVGLMHASMAIFNAFCDRVPILMLGANGPMSADQRRPWIDWIHTSVDQAALVRHFVKLDDQPASLVAAVEGLVAANRATRTYPKAPVYVTIDAAIQESALAEDVPQVPDVDRYAAPESPFPSTTAVARVIDIARASDQTVLLVGRVGRGTDAWDARIELADALDAMVLTDLKQPAAFPTPHTRHPAVAGNLLTPSGVALLRSATAIIALDWVDLSGTLSQALGSAQVDTPVVHCTMDHVLHTGFSGEHFGAAPVDVGVEAHPDAFVTALLERLQVDPIRRQLGAEFKPNDEWRGSSPLTNSALTVQRLASELRCALADEPSCLVRIPLSWRGEDVIVRHPLDFLGYDGGGGIGSGPGMIVGAALALYGSGRLPVAVLGDGDTLMGATALWTAAHHRLPLLVVVANNRSFGNDEIHQERVATTRGRPVANSWIGQHIRDPEPDIAGLARSLGLVGYGPVADPGSLGEVLVEAVARARAGEAVLVDVHTEHERYMVAPSSAVDGSREER
jgi:thiamine pyrophosphate-dependent acetolactate synthase large subunit-like protein